MTFCFCFLTRMKSGCVLQVCCRCIVYINIWNVRNYVMMNGRGEGHVSIEEAPPGRKGRWVDRWQPCKRSETRYNEMLGR